MKKLAIGAVTVAMMSLGMVGTATTAHADDYTGTVAVKVDKKTKTDLGNKKKKVAKVDLSAGNLTPAGTAKTVCKAGGKKVVRTAPVTKKGQARTGKLTKGKWTCKVKFTAAEGSVFKSGKSKVSVRVS